MPAYTEEQRERARQCAARWYAENRQRAIQRIVQRQREAGYSPQRRARNLLAKAVRRGELVRPQCCAECGAGGRITAHHPDYSKPLEVEWLCTRCHGKKHQQDDSKAAA